LNYRIADEKLDPLSIYDNTGMKTIIERKGLIVPDVQDKTVEQIRNIYIKVCLNLYDC
jgi:hypothetical protein